MSTTQTTPRLRHEQPTSGEPCRVPLRRRAGTIVAYALVDASDYEWLMRWRWHLSSYGYARRGEGPGRNRRFVSMHREILGLEFGDPRQGDHRNLDRLDNRRENLRIAPRGDKDNSQNVGSNAGSSSRYRGVYWHELSQKWMARAQVDGTNHYLGLFADENEAGAVASAFRAAHMPFSADAARCAS